jgi:hypothetical protein
MCGAECKSTQKLHVREEEHDVKMLMLYIMNPMLDDKGNQKKNAQRRVLMVEDLG